MQKKLATAAAVIHGPKVLFLDEPFEGVDAIAAGMLKAMLQGMITAAPLFFSPRMCLKLSSDFAVTSQSSTKGGWWPTARSRNCARA